MFPDENDHGKYAVAVMIGGQTGGHIPKNLNRIFKLFLTLPNCVIKCKVIGNRINRGAGYRLEIPAQYKFFGLGKAVDWAEKIVRMFIHSVEKEQRIIPSNNFRRNM